MTHRIIFFFLLVGFFVPSVLMAQVKAPKLILPAPDAYSFTKYGDIPVGLFTGTMSYSLPLMNVKSGKIELPVSLDYSTNGVKVDEVSGRTGIGWNLRSGGVITRNIIGKADDVIPLTAPPAADSNSWAFYVYMQAVTNQNANTQPDEFTYSFMGYSGKFYFDYNGQVRQLTPNGFKITATDQLYEFKIITTDGTEYFFGQQNRDYTDSYSFFGENNPMQTYGQGGYSAWYLHKIRNSSGDSVIFKYSAISNINHPLEYFSGITQTNVLNYRPYSSLISYIQSSNCAPDGNVAVSNWSAVPCQNDVGLTTDYNMSRLSVVKLDEIIFNQGRVSFFYSDRLDLPGEKKIDSIVTYNVNDKHINTVRLNFVYAESSSMYNMPLIYSPAQYEGYTFQDYYAYLKKRLFLKQVSIYGRDTSFAQVYKFDYNDINGLPARLSFAQDKFGYFNGGVESQFTSSDVFMSIAFGAPLIGRKTDTGFIQKGVLTKIQYPTGGYTAIQYEANTIGSIKPLYDTVLLSINNPSATGGTIAYSSYFKVSTPLSLEVRPKWLSQPDPMAPFLDSIVMVSIEDSITGNCLILPQCPVTATPSLPFVGYYDKLYFLVNKGPFRLKVQSFRPDIAVDVSFIDFDYDTIPYNKPTGGVRVASIENFSADNQKANTKKYRYNMPDKAWSSGSLINDFQDSRDFAYYKRSICSQPNELLGANLVLSSSSSLGGFANDYLSVNYEYVTEVQDSLGKNGSVLTRFFIEGNRLPTTFSCAANDSPNVHSPFLIQGIPYSNTGVKNGKQREQKIFRYENGKQFLQKHTQQFYSVDSRNYYVDSFFVVRRQYTRQNYYPNYKYFADYDVNKYKRYTAWVHLDSVLEHEYDNGGGYIKNATSYYYDNPDHMQQTRIITWNSKGDMMTSQLKYAGDMGNLFPYNLMIARNMSALPIEQIRTIGNKQLSLQRTEYDDWFSSRNLIMPKHVKAQAEINDPLEARLTFLAYDSMGNPLSIITPEGINISYVWGTKSENPLAEVVNAKIGEVAYCSFENDGKGSWEFDMQAQVKVADAITGKGAYQLNERTIYHNGLLASGSYVIRFWTKENAVVLVNGIHPVTVTTRNGWQLKQSIIKGATSVSISGSGIIDELKLFPEQAQIKTFVFEPLIGMTSQADTNDKIVYYEYDSLSRLKLIRDEFRNIIKTYQYNYQK